MSDIKEGNKRFRSGECRARSHPVKFTAVLTKAGRFLNSMSAFEVRPRSDGNGDLRARSHPASLLPVLTKTGKSLNSFATFNTMYLLSFSKNQEGKVIKC